jgi:hypothetical protein
MSNNFFEIARRDLVAALAAMPVPNPYESFPSARSHEEVGEHIHHVARIVDTWLHKIGVEIKSNSTAGIDMRCFVGVFADTVEGFACFEATRAAEIVREESRGNGLTNVQR